MVKYLADGEAQTIVFTAWDYGGQTVFHPLHSLFLTRCGVYVAVFSMVEMLADQAETVAGLRHWLHSIVAHARGPRGDTPPIILVGTHKDHVRSFDFHSFSAFLTFNYWSMFCLLSSHSHTLSRC